MLRIDFSLFPDPPSVSSVACDWWLMELYMFSLCLLAVVSLLSAVQEEPRYSLPEVSKLWRHWLMGKQTLMLPTSTLHPGVMVRTCIQSLGPTYICAERVLEHTPIYGWTVDLFFNIAACLLHDSWLSSSKRTHTIKSVRCDQHQKQRKIWSEWLSEVISITCFCCWLVFTPFRGLLWRVLGLLARNPLNWGLSDWYRKFLWLLLSGYIFFFVLITLLCLEYHFTILNR